MSMPSSGRSWPIVLLLTSPILSFQATYFVIGTLYLFILHQRCIAKNIGLVNRSVAIHFVSACVASAVLIAFHFDKISDPLFRRYFELVLIVPILIITFDAVSSYVRHFKPDLRNSTNIALSLILLFFVLRVIEVLLTNENFSWEQVISLNDRRNLLVTYNPNTADDYFLYGFVLCFFFIVINRGVSLITKFMGGLLALVFAFFFIKSDSLGGTLGLFTGLIMIVATLLLVHRNNPRFYLFSIYAIATTLICCFALMIVSPSLSTKSSNIITGAYAILSERYALGDYVRCDPQNPNEPPIVNTELISAQSFAYRLLIYNSGLKMVEKSLPYGTGVFDKEKAQEQFPEIEECVFNNFAHLHNLYLDVLVLGGIPLFLYLVVSVLLFVRFSIHQALNDRIAAGLVGIFFTSTLMVQNLFDLNLVFFSYLQAMVICIAGMMASVAKSRTMPPKIT